MSRLQKSEDIIGKNVANSSGYIIGEVHDYLIDLETWQVTDLQVKIEKPKAKELGLKAPFFGALLVLFDVGLIISAEDQIIVSLERDAIKPYVDRRKEEAKRGGAPSEDDER